MKKVTKKLFIFLTMLSLLMSTAATVFAAGTVTYDGNAKEFIFAPGSDYSPTDLFENFKNVMPGDSITQQITVKNDSSNGVKIKIYMRSLGAHEDSVDFLSQLHMTVAKSEYNTMAYMFDAEADQTDGLTDWVPLGILYSGGEVNLDITLEVPVELNNEYQEAIGYLDWQFKVEEYPIEEDDPKPPQTGDNANLPIYIALMSVSGLAVVFLLLLKRRRQPE